MANQDRVNFVWAESALTTIPPIPVSEVAYRDTTQTPEQMEVGQQYDTIYNSARYNQLLFLLTSVAKTLCENGIMPFLAGQEYSQYARCIFTDGKLYTASRAILANEQPYPTPGDDSGVWIAEETSENLVPNSRRVIAGTGLTGGGPLSSDVTLSAKLDGKTTQAAADGAITVKDVAIGGDLGDLASARGQVGDAKEMPNLDFNTLTTPGNYRITGNPTNGPSLPLNIPGSSIGSLIVAGIPGQNGRIFQIMISSSAVTWRTTQDSTGTTWSAWQQLLSGNKVGDGIRVTNGIISVPEYEGATASKAGTSGLVPPAAAGQHESFLTGGGEYKPALSFTPVQQGGGSGQDNSKIYIGHGTNGLKAQIGTTDLGYIVTTAAGTTKAANSASADRAQVAGSAETLFVTGWGNTKWGSTPYEQSPLYVWCLPTSGSDMQPCSPSVISAGAANWCIYTPNVAIGDNSAVPQGGTWKYFSWGYDTAANGVVAGGTNISNRFIAIRVS